MRIRLEPRGVLVALEGIDGAGKSTQARELERLLALAGFGVVRTREPTDGPWGRKLRESATAGRLSPTDELAAFVADRRQHVAEEIAPALADGKIVLIDRYYFSSAAYQGARGLDPDEIIRQNEAFAPEPDLLVILVVDPAGGVARVGQRGQHDHFEREADLARSAAIFARMDKPYLIRIDATRPAGEITAAILTALAHGPMARWAELLPAKK